MSENNIETWAPSWLVGLDTDEPLVQREGAAVRTADELNVQFITDALDTVESLFERCDSAERRMRFGNALYEALRSRSLHAEENVWSTTVHGDYRYLTSEGVAEFLVTLREWTQELDAELAKDSSPSKWFERDDSGSIANDTLADPEELEEDMESVLSALGLRVDREDGYWVTVDTDNG